MVMPFTNDGVSVPQSNLKKNVNGAVHRILSGNRLHLQHGPIDLIIVVDDHITGMLSEHQAGRFLGMPPSGLRVRGRRSTPGRYFQVAEPGHEWGGTNIKDPLEIIDPIKPGLAYSG